MHKHDWLHTVAPKDLAQHHTTFWDHLAKHAYPLSQGSMRIPISMEPLVMTEAEHATLETQVRHVLSAAHKLVEQYATNTQLQELIHLHPSEKRLIEASLAEPLVGIVRIDVLHGAQPQMVEINADFPDGFFMHDVTARAIATAHPATNRAQLESHADLHTTLLASEGVTPEQHIFVAYNQGREFLDEFELTRLELRKRGWQHVCIGPIESLEFEGGNFYAHGKKVEVLKRGTELSKIRNNPHLAERLITAQAQGLRILNNFKLRLLGHKALMAALHDARFGHYLTTEERVSIGAFVPLTYKFEAMDIRTLITDRGHWVVKPSDLAEGASVYVGSSMTDEAWVRALAHASQNSRAWIVQQKVPLPTQTFTLFNETTDKAEQAVAHYDTNPHVVLFRDGVKFGNTLVRFSSSEVVNVMKGGGITYALKIPTVRI